jgi:hypothetical protein
VDVVPDVAGDAEDVDAANVGNGRLGAAVVVPAVVVLAVVVSIAAVVSVVVVDAILEITLFGVAAVLRTVSLSLPTGLGPAGLAWKAAKAPRIISTSPMARARRVVLRGRGWSAAPELEWGME